MYEKNNKNISITELNIDYWNKIDSTWDSAGKPEQYKNNYQFGKGVKNTKSKLSKKLIKSQSNKIKRGY